MPARNLCGLFFVLSCASFSVAIDAPTPSLPASKEDLREFRKVISNLNVVIDARLDRPYGHRTPHLSPTTGRQLQPPPVPADVWLNYALGGDEPEMLQRILQGAESATVEHHEDYMMAITTTVKPSNRTMVIWCYRDDYADFQQIDLAGFANSSDFKGIRCKGLAQFVQTLIAGTEMKEENGR
jgi:hypothetical protein